MSSRGRGGGHGRMICAECGGEHPVNRENLKRKQRFSGKFLCKRCERRQGRPLGRPKWGRA